uniref:Uncharacterized protein n=1 Tax=Rhizophora mucronata TaxID=61149 RepID=A0A2P2NEM7_RHIMU
MDPLNLIRTVHEVLLITDKPLHRK